MWQFSEYFYSFWSGWEHLFLFACLPTEKVSPCPRWFASYEPILIRHVTSMQLQLQGFLWPLYMDFQNNSTTLARCSCSLRCKPPEQLREPECCCIRHGCSFHMCHSVSQSLQTWRCWWPGLLLGIPGEVQVHISASAVENSNYQFGLDVPLILVRTHFLSATSQRISCLGHHQNARKGLDHCCLVGETNGEHGTKSVMAGHTSWGICLNCRLLYSCKSWRNRSVEPDLLASIDQCSVHSPMLHLSPFPWSQSRQDHHLQEVWTWSVLEITVSTSTQCSNSRNGLAKQIDCIYLVF